jgi:hypothetical protein
MSHPLLKAAIRLFCTSILLITSAEIAGGACSCPPTPTVLDAYEAADAVMIVRVLSVQKIEGTQLGPIPFLAYPGMLTVRVERVYKGNFKVNEQLTYSQNVLMICPWFSTNIEIDNELLVYLKAPHGPYIRWQAAVCGRTRFVSQATEDLLYLDKLTKVGGKTRVSGKYGGWGTHDIPLAHRRIGIVNYTDEKAYETFTDEKGFFEIYDLPPGNYRLEPEIPEGWRIDRWSLWRSASTVGSRPDKTGFPFFLDPQKHASVGFEFEPDNAVEGKIVGPKGNALPSTCAYLRRPKEILTENVNWWELRSVKSGCTDEQGRFRIEAVPPGTYVLMLNVNGMPRSREPFPSVFSPGTTELEKAALIEIAPGQIIKDVNVKVPFLLETITVTGTFYFSDGRPVPKQEVRFEPIEKPGIDGLVITETDEQGRFSLKILKGLQGEIYGGMVVEARTIRCPEIASLNFNPHDRVYVRALGIKLEADRDLSDLALRLLYPNCLAKR